MLIRVFPGTRRNALKSTSLIIPDVCRLTGFHGRGLTAPSLKRRQPTGWSSFSLI